MKKSFLLMVSLLFISFAYSQTTVELYQNDFDSYTPGDYLGVVDPDNWEPWGGTPGASDDAVVSDDQSYSAPNSFVVDEVGGATDIVWKLGDKITGEYQVGWWMYVVSGSEGYYNFQKTQVPGTEWAFEIYFRTDGTVEFQIDQTTVATTTYTPDTWFYMDHIINLDDDEAEIFLDGTSFHTWQWTQGGLLQLGGVDFYAATNVVYYVDDVLYEQIFAPIYCDDFEGYTVGDYIAEENPEFWATWSGTPGGTEDAIISDDQAYMGTNSLYIDYDGGSSDIVLKLGDKTSGSFEVNWYIYVPSAANAYYNFQKTELPGTEWACDVFFYDDGTGEFQIDQVTLTTFNYAPDTWLYLEHKINLDEDTAMFYIDGTMIYSWQWSNGGLLQLGGVDFYNIDATYYYYVDDLCYLQTGGSTDPAIEVTPAELTEELEQGQTSEQMLNVANIGAANLEYSVAIVYDVEGNRSFIPLDDEKLSHVSMDQYASVPTNGGPAPATDDETLTYCDINESAIGLTTAGNQWEVAAKFPSSMMNEYVGMELSSVMVFINEVAPADEFKLRVYEMGLNTMPGNLIYEQDFTSLGGTWEMIDLDTPVPITGEDLWVGYWINQTDLTFPAGCGCTPAVFNGDWIRTAAAWGHLSSNPDLNYNWNIVATLTGTPIETWLTVDPTSGTVSPGSSDDLTVTFDATNLNVGTYMAEIFVFSNDMQNPSVSVPVTLDVTEGVPTGINLNFEEQDDFALTFDPWTALDVDGGNTYSISNHTFPNQGVPMAYIAFNPAMVDPPMTEPAIQPYEGERFGACFSSVPPPTNDDWLISPQVTLGLNSEFTFWVKSYTGDYGLERYNVAISTTGMNPEDFTYLNTGGYLEAPEEAWEQQVWDISDYDGQTVYCAIQCVSEDAFIFMVDDIWVNWDPVGIAEIPADAEFSVYPNPARDYVTINSSSSIKQIKVFNYVGQVIVEEIVGDEVYTINTAGIESGIYFIQVETTEGWSTRKVIIE